MTGDDENEQQVSPVTEEDPNGNHTPVTGGSKPLLSKSTKISFVGMANAAKKRKQNAYRRMKKWKKELKRFKLEEELDLDNSMVLENESRKRQKPLYEKLPKKTENFLSKDYTRWEILAKHLKAVAKTNRWIDSQNCCNAHLFNILGY